MQEISVSLIGMASNELANLLNKWKKKADVLVETNVEKDVPVDVPQSRVDVPTGGHVKQLAGNFQKKIDEAQADQISSIAKDTFFKQDATSGVSLEGMRPLLYASVARSWRKPLPTLRAAGADELIPAEAAALPMDGSESLSNNSDSDADDFSDDEVASPERVGRPMSAAPSSPSRSPARCEKSPAHQPIPDNGFCGIGAEEEEDEAQKPVEYVDPTGRHGLIKAGNESAGYTHMNYLYPDGNSYSRKLSLKERKTIKALQRGGFKLMKGGEAPEFVSLSFENDFIVMTQPMTFIKNSKTVSAPAVSESISPAAASVVQGGGDVFVLIGHFANLATGGSLPDYATDHQRVITTGQYMRYLDAHDKGAQWVAQQDQDGLTAFKHDLKIVKQHQKAIAAAAAAAGNGALTAGKAGAQLKFTPPQM